MRIYVTRTGQRPYTVVCHNKTEFYNRFILGCDMTDVLFKVSPRSSVADMIEALTYISNDYNVWVRRQ